MLAVATLFTGCETVKSWFTKTLSDEQKVANICSSVQTLTAKGITSVITKNPDLKQYFAISAESLKILVGAGTIDPKAINIELEKALAGVPEEYKVAVFTTLNSAISVYTFFFETNIDSKLTIVQESCKKILTSLLTGIEIGCGYELKAATPVVGVVKPLDSFTKSDVKLLGK